MSMAAAPDLLTPWEMSVKALNSSMFLCHGSPMLHLVEACDLRRSRGCQHADMQQAVSAALYGQMLPQIAAR